MAVLVEGQVVAVEEVPADEVVGVAVPIVVEAVHGVRGVDPDVVAQFRVVDRYPAVDHRHGHGRGGRVEVHRLGPVDIGVGGSRLSVHHLAGVLEAPLFPEPGIAGDPLEPMEVVRLRGLDLGQRAQDPDRLLDREAGWEAVVPDPQVRDLVEEGQAVGLLKVGDPGCCGLRGEANQDLARHVGGLARQLDRRSRLDRDRSQDGKGESERAQYGHELGPQSYPAPATRKAW